MWCSKSTLESLTDQIARGEHSPDTFRVLGSLSNFDEFSKAFNCKIGSNMNNNSSKCQMW